MSIARTPSQLALVLSLLACALAPRPALAQADPAPSLFDVRRGLHAGVGIGPLFSWYPALTDMKYGVDTRFFLNVGLTNVVDFRFGLAGGGVGSGVTYLSVGAPAEVRFNLGTVYSIALGVSPGMVTDTMTVGFYLGPDWSLLGLRFGPRREFEVEVAQGVHFYLDNRGQQTNFAHFQTSLVLSYLFLDSPS